MKNNKIIKVSSKLYRKTNKFHTEYYSDNRSLSQFFWLFKKEKFNDLKNYFLYLKENKICSSIGFIKYNFTYKNRLISCFKPEDVLSNVEGIKNNAFEKINQKFEKKKNNFFFFNFSNVGWAFKKLNYKINFGNRFTYLKFYKKRALERILKQKKYSSFKIYFITNIFFLYLNFFDKLKVKSNNELIFKISDNCPAWVDSLFKSFINYWECFTVVRSKEFLSWRIFNNPFKKNKFISIYDNKTPIGYFIFEIDKKVLSVIDIVIVPRTKKMNSKYIINEIIRFIDNYCINKNIEYSKFEIYLDFKLNKIIKTQLLKNYYLKNKKKSDFSFKTNIQFIMKEISKENFYLTNILKAGR